MFFDTLGRLLLRSGEVLRTDVRPHVGDDFAQRQVDAIALLVSEVGAAWEGLFAALRRENEILARTLAEAERSLGWSPTTGGSGDADPLRGNAELLEWLAATVSALHDRGDEAALRALAGVRRGLAEAAGVEHELLQHARERSGMATVRRV